MRIRKLLFSSLFLAGLSSVAILNMSSSGGQMGAFSSGCGTSNCHGTANTATTISLSGIPSSGYVTGTNYPLTLTITNTDSNLTKGGFDLKFGAGTLSNAPSGTMLMGTELHHTQPKNKTGNSVSWSFNWTAPAAATTTVNVAANMVNGNGQTSGDQWNISTITLIKSTLSVSDAVNNPVVVSPNPCTNQLNIRNDKNIDKVEVFSIYGQKQMLNGEAQGNNFRLNTAGLSEGIYFVFVHSDKAVWKSSFTKQ